MKYHPNNKQGPGQFLPTAMALAVLGFAAFDANAAAPSLPSGHTWGADITVNDSQNIVNNSAGVVGNNTLSFGSGNWGYTAGTAHINGAGIVTPSVVSPPRPDTRSNVQNPYSNPTPVSPNAQWPSVWEDQEVEPRSNIGQQWDLEALFYKAPTYNLNGDLVTSAGVSILAGYNMALGEGGFKPGDIFLDLDGSVQTGTWGGSAYNLISNNNLGYDFVIHFTDYDTSALHTDDFGANYQSGYQIIDIRNATGLSLVDVFYDENSVSNPFRYVSGGSVLPGGTGTATVYGGLSDADVVNKGSGGYDFIGGSHYLLDLPDVQALITAINAATPGPVDDFGVHVTYGCGNDELVAYFNPNTSLVPEAGATLALLGAGLAGLGFAGRRLRR